MQSFLFNFTLSLNCSLLLSILLVYEILFGISETFLCAVVSSVRRTSAANVACRDVHLE
jgi:hypothetical protein